MKDPKMRATSRFWWVGGLTLILGICCYGRDAAAVNAQRDAEAKAGSARPGARRACRMAVAELDPVRGAVGRRGQAQCQAALHIADEAAAPPASGDRVPGSDPVAGLRRPAG